MRDDVSTLSAQLSLFDSWHDDGVLDDVAYGVLTREYAARLQRLHLARTPPSGSAPAPAAVRPAVAATASTPPTSVARTPSGPSFNLAAWAAERQADILLYLGAFLLVIAALVFIGYQGETLPGLGRVALLAGYTVGFTAAGVGTRRWARVREAAPVFLAVGALLTPLNFILLQIELLDDRSVAPDVVWLLGSVYSALLYAVLFARGFGRLYAIPAAIGAVSAWAALSAVVDLPFEWLSAWFMAPTVAMAAATARWSRMNALVTVATGLVAGTVLVTSLVASEAGAHRGQFPVTWALVTAWLAVAGVHWRVPATLLVATTTAIGSAIGVLWALDVDPQWYVIPTLLGGAALTVSRPWWTGWSLGLARAGWMYSAAGAISPAVLAVFTEQSPCLAAGGHLAGAAILGSIAWRNTTDGLAVGERDGVPVTPLGERVVFGWAAFAVLLAAVGYGQEALAVAPPDSGWVFVGLAAAAIALIAATAREDERAVAILLPPVFVAGFVSLQPWDRFTGHDAVLLAIPAIALVGAALFTRRWSLAAAALVPAGGAAAAGWHAMDWETWKLAIAFFAAGALLFLALTPLRDYDVARGRFATRSIALLMLSWGLALAAPLVATAALAVRVDGGATGGVATVEYRTFAFLLLALSALPAIEGWRHRNWNVTAAATGLAAVALATIWPVFEWETWTLAVAFGALGTLRFFLLTGQRTYEASPQQQAIVVLSWGPVLAAPLSAAVALNSLPESVEAVTTVEYRTLVFFVLVGAALLAFEGWRLRNWGVKTAAVAVAAAGIAGIWPAFDWAIWTLAPVYALTGGALFIALAPSRVYGPEPRQSATTILSWGVLLLAPATAQFAVEQRVSVSAVATVEYRTLALMVLVIAPAIAFDGRRLGSGLTVWIGTAVAAAAGLMAIAILEPENVQAYTVPAAAFLIGSGLIIRRSIPLIDPHLLRHEVVLIVGALVLALPQAEQSLESGGASWGFALLGEALFFVAASLLLRARWLAVAGVLTASVVGARWLAESGETVPYWMTLGVAGLMLLVLGVLLLVYREQWSRVQNRVFHWWQHAPLRT